MRETELRRAKNCKIRFLNFLFEKLQSGQTAYQFLNRDEVLEDNQKDTDNPTEAHQKVTMENDESVRGFP